MLKHLLLAITLFISVYSALVVAVEVNTADQAALESVAGLGPTRAKVIIEERQKNGPFKDANDLSARVKGIGKKSIARLQEKGLTIDGQAKNKPISKKSKQKKSNDSGSSEGTGEVANPANTSDTNAKP